MNTRAEYEAAYERKHPSPVAEYWMAEIAKIIASDEKDNQTRKGTRNANRT